MNLTPIRIRVPMRLAAALLAAGAAAPGVGAGPWTLEYSNVSNGYSNCTYQDNSDGTSTVGVTINYNSTRGHLGQYNRRFFSRGVMIYSYDMNGVLQSSLGMADKIYKVFMNDTLHIGESASTSPLAYSMFGYAPSHPNPGAWHNENAQTVRVKVILKNTHFSVWPAVGLRAGNITYGNDVAEIKGLAYISKSSTSGTCEVITNPEIPPPPDPAIAMNAPDWNLGELLLGMSTEKPFSGAAEQLCFTYEGPRLAGVHYAVNAANQNGLSGTGSYQLRHLASPADAVPYRVVLRNTLTNISVELPNNRNVVSTFGDSGRECFNPTFTADTPKTAKEGDYGDVLNFTVVAQP
ncbi:hypothetical protein [Achromobacter anxifer]|jgi:hypothetical protein|uniref:hypothetical protein n=1 Tax=Achromobacter anxifer TaxID=1287737 RepID=UPI00155C6B2C|nr:hypothetical protein [Achromobacter anxifer]MDF8361471.1 hypothetical protein [Achromobacter anxifer]CAB5513184.1 hypothetical protein LMG26857_02461 [Achromobacter anxifer]